MNHIVSQMLIYGRNNEGEILSSLSDIFKKYNDGGYDRDELVKRTYEQISRILVLSTDCGFDENLWHCYLSYILVTDENPFSLTCEKKGSGQGSVNAFARQDFRCFKALFDYDFSNFERDLGIDCFSVISHYRALEKPAFMFNKNVSEKVKALSRELEGAADENEFFEIVTGFYKKYGVGMFGLNKAFRVETGNGVSFKPINNMDTVTLCDLVGYETQKEKLLENTCAFVEGKKANNVLLFGDSGTGKSTSIKAIVNQFYDEGLRMIEIYKHQFKHLSDVIARIKNRNYKFIIYMDDLSFEEFETEYKFLKAVIEGGVETKPDNILIYATSNRRHIIKEVWSDRDDVEQKAGIHRSDTMEEKLSLVNRFGVTISYSKPTQKEFFEIVIELARREGINLSDEELMDGANRWELSHGGISGRTARQFVTHLLGTR